jgi:hypothetical protein
MRTTMKLIPLLLMAVACAPIDTGLGNAVRHNMALQIIDPEPTHAGTPIEAGSGARSALAFDRYRKGRVLDPKPAGGARPFEISGQGAGGGAPKM